MTTPLARVGRDRAAEQADREEDQDLEDISPTTRVASPGW